MRSLVLLFVMWTCHNNQLTLLELGENCKRTRCKLEKRITYIRKFQSLFKFDRRKTGLLPIVTEHFCNYTHQASLTHWQKKHKAFIHYSLQSYAPNIILHLAVFCDRYDCDNTLICYMKKICLLSHYFPEWVWI